MKQEVGTIKELGLKVGDMAQCVDAMDGGVFTSGIIYEMTDKGLTCDGMVPQRSSVSTFTVINRASTPEKGTLAELDVKPGDVVEDTDDGMMFTVSKVDRLVSGETIWPSGRIVHNDSWSLDGVDTWRIFTRATDAPQRYVVVTDTETVIATRAEAEDLVTSGGVMSVYKLGDEVGMTTTVTLD